MLNHQVIIDEIAAHLKGLNMPCCSTLRQPEEGHLYFIFEGSPSVSIWYDCNSLIVEYVASYQGDVMAGAVSQVAEKLDLSWGYKKNC